LIVGVVGDAKYSSLESDVPATLYLPATQVPPSAVSFEVRVAGRPASLLPTVRDVVSSQFPGVAMASVRTMEEQLEEVTARPRQAARVAGVFGLVAVLLACLGLSGVVSYDVTQRSRELGVRVALGATESQIAILVVRDVLVVVGIGSVAGVAIAISAAVGGQPFFSGLRPLDFLALLASVAMFALVASAAVLPPALRAARLAPSVGLKQH
jgi:ABC-type antimicrobial peptide transport system permease subunit